MSEALRRAAFSLLLLISAPAFSQGQVCDVDADSDVDVNDISAILAARNTAASGPDDPRDADGDGFITVLDARICILQCTLPGCAEPVANTPPVADAGPDRSAELGEAVTLDGAGSFDADGDALTFSWQFVALPAGSAATLDDPSLVMPTFVADVAGDYVIELVVNDGTIDSAADEVVVVTVPENTPPVADAGPDQAVNVNDTVTLDGSGSTDVDGDPLTFSWTLAQVPAGSTATLSDRAAVMPTFVVDEPGTYVAELVVDDGQAGSFPDTVVVTTLNIAPVADAGPDQQVPLFGTAMLDGSGSFDADGDALTFAWALTNVPAGSAAALDDPASVTPSFVADEPGTYVAQLIVNDGAADSAPDTVVVTTENTQPVADAGPDRAVQQGDTVELDGSGSSDADGDPLTYAWSFTAQPAGSGAVLSDPLAAAPFFDADLPGLFVVQLIVNDGQIDSDPDTSTITVEEIAGIDILPAVLDLLTSETQAITLTLDAPAGAGGVTIDLASDDTQVATVPAAVTIAEGQASATADVTAGTTAGSALITATSPGLADGTATVNVANRGLTVSLSDELIGVGRSVDGAVDLAGPAPAGGVTVDLAIADTGVATTSTATVLIAAGDTQGTFEVNGVTEGMTTLTASAPGYEPDTIPVETTANLISFGNLDPIGPGQSVDLAVSIVNPATGDLTIDFVSLNEGIATIDASVVIPNGQQTPLANPTVTGVSLGTTQVVASAPGFASDTRDVIVTLDLALSPNDVEIIEGEQATLTLNLSAAAPVGGLTVDLSIDDTDVATVAPTVTMPEGQTSAPVVVTAGNIGTTTLRANAPGVAEATAAIETIELDLGGIFVGIPSGGQTLPVGPGLLTALNVRLDNAPPAPVDIVLTVDDDALARLSDDVATLGTATVTIAGVADTATQQVFLQGIAVGNATLTATAPNYDTEVVPVPVEPSGFVISSGDINTNTFAANTELFIRPVLMNPVTLVPRGFGSNSVGVGPGIVSVPVASSDEAVGVVTVSPVVFDVGDFQQPTEFDPLAAGTTVISLGTPPGFTPTPTTGNLRSEINATVEAPAIFVTQFGQNVTTPLRSGAGLQKALIVRFETAPPAPVDVTLTVADPALATLSLDGNVAGGTTVTLTGIGDTNQRQLVLQGIAVGDTTVTATAPGFETAVRPVPVDPAGFIIRSGLGSTSFSRDITTDTFATDTPEFIVPVVLDRNTLEPLAPNTSAGSGYLVRAGTTVSVPVTSSDPTVGVMTVDPVVFNGNDTNLQTDFDPLDAGITVIDVGTPPGFTAAPTTGNFRTRITATVEAPEIVMTLVGTGTSQPLRVGAGLQMPINVRLESAPPAPVDVTFTIGDPALAALSLDGDVAGSTTVTLVGIGDTATRQIFLQGLAIGDTTVTASAPGFATTVRDAPVDPAGFVIRRGIGGTQVSTNITTTTFAANTDQFITPVVMDRNTFEVQEPRGNPWVQLRVRAATTVSVPVTSSDPSVGIMTVDPVVFNGNDTNLLTRFDPLTAGMTTITVGTPPGFTPTPTTGNFRSQITATVNAPGISVTHANAGGGNPLRTGAGMQIPLDVRLLETPPNPVDITLTIAAGALANLSLDPTAAGGTSVTLTGIADTAARLVYLQGIAIGDTTLTATAPGFETEVRPVPVDPAGFVIRSPAGFSCCSVDFTTNTAAPNSVVRITPVVMDRATLVPQDVRQIPWGGLRVRPGLMASVPVTSSDTAVGVIVTSPVVFNGGDAAFDMTTEFDPLAVGTTVLAVEAPAGFTQPVTTGLFRSQLTVTVE